MARANFQAFAVDAQGNILSGASVEVRDTNGALLAASAIFTGYTGSGTVSSNPFTAGSDGLIQFYVEGSQVLTITATSGANTATWSNVVLNELFTPSDYALNSSLGTAAAANLTTSATDTTAGRVLKVGDFGVGGSGSAQTTSIEDIDFPAPMVRLGSGSNPGGLPFAVGAGDVLQSFRWDNNARMQMIYRRSTSSGTNPARIAINSTSNGTDWYSDELWTTGNYKPETSLGVGVVRIMKNNSGSGIGDQQSVAGSSLKAVFFDSSGNLQGSSATITGTWVNVGGSGCSSQNTREFVRIA